METLSVRTNKARDVIDITKKVEQLVAQKEFENGLCCLFITHTTAALATADLDPGTDQDMLDAFEAMMPKLRYRHPHDPEHVTEHIMASLIGPSVVLPIHDGKLVLGTWQSVVLLEFSGPRERQIVASFMANPR